VDIYRRFNHFSIAGPTAWNSLPGNLRDPPVGSEQIRRKLKTHLFALHRDSLA